MFQALWFRQDQIIAKSVCSGLQLPGFECQPGELVAGRPWARYLIFLNFHLLLGKLRKFTAPPYKGKARFNAAICAKCLDIVFIPEMLAIIITNIIKLS